MASTAPSPPRRHPFSKKKPRATASLLLSFVVVVASAFIVVVVEGSEHPASSVNANAASVVADRRGGRRSARSFPPPPRRVAFAPSPAAIAVGRTDRRPFRRGTGIVMSERGGGSGEGEEGTTTKTTVPESCDYLVVGGGATGMSFVDTLLAHHPEVDPPLKVAMVDARTSPGGQWHDGYKFVRLHQPSSMYGVETAKLEPEEEEGGGGGGADSADRHRATREEILEYYDGLRRKYENERGFAFLGGRTFDFDEMTKKDRPDDGEGILCELKPVSSDDDGSAGAAAETILVKRRIVDARFLEPDLPIHVPPKFAFDDSVVRCVPVNSIVEPDGDDEESDSTKRTKRYVVIGAGKTGMDAVSYLQTSRNVDPDDIVWVVPNDPWITAREDIGGCMEFLHSCLTLAKRKLSEGGGEGDDERSMKEMVASERFLQDGFLEWERRGKIYRLDEDAALPTKFKDATLDRDELNLIRRVANVVRRGRVKEIRNDGSLVMEDGTTVNLPWKEEEDDDFDVDDVTFVHCSAGAFHYSKQPDLAPPPFAKDVITIQDVYGTPGFCFVGSIFAMLECLDDRLSDEEKNDMCLSPQRDAEEARLPLGPSGGDVGILSRDHGYVQRASNLRKWLKDPDVRSWLVGHRLFNLGKYGADEMEGMVEEIWDALEESDLVEKE